MRNASFEIRPIAGAIGAELQGVDLAAELPDSWVAAIRQALLEHGVIFFRDQDLPLERFLALARRFGPPVEYPFLKGIEGFPEIIAVTKLEHETVNFGGVWHSDTTYLQEPPMATLLVAREVPEVGGDTLFANQYLAYETLSDGMKQLLGGPLPCRPGGMNVAPWLHPQSGRHFVGQSGAGSTVLRRKGSPIPRSRAREAARVAVQNVAIGCGLCRAGNRSGLLVAQRHHRIQPGRLVGRPYAEKQADAGGHRKAGD